MRTIDVLIADDHAIVRKGLVAILATDGGVRVVAEAGNGRQALDLVRTHDPDVVIMDVGMPGLNGIEATKQILSDAPYVKVMALSVHNETGFIEAMLCAGARGYLLKNAALDELLPAIRVVASGQTYLSPGIRNVMVQSRSKAKGPVALASPLTGREREIVQMVAEGCTSQEIARHLFISVRTVDAHRRAIARKLDLHSVADLTKFALREGLTML